MTFYIKSADPHASYVAPKLQRLGSLETVTKGHSAGTKTDAAFPVNTPRGNITFS